LSSCERGCGPSRHPRRTAPTSSGSPRSACSTPASPYADCPPGLARALIAGAGAAKQKIETALSAGGLAPVVNGWTLTFHIFDYNVDHLGLGTIDDPAWKISDRSASYLARTLAARAGLWGNHGYEAA
jgi:hypothetical protein